MSLIKAGFSAVLFCLFSCWPLLLSSASIIDPANFKPFNLTNYPNPLGAVEHWACHVDRPSQVCDPDSLLSKEEHSELQALVERTLALSKETTSIGLSCAQMGIRLGIAVAYFPLEETVIKTLYNSTEQQWRDSLGYPNYPVRYLFDAVWERLRALEEERSEPRDVLAAQLAKKWGLLPAGGSAGGCAAMLLLSANPQHLHIFAQLPLPITAAEKKAIAEAQMPLLMAGKRSQALKAAVQNLFKLIQRRQALMDGHVAAQSPSSTAAGHPPSFSSTPSPPSSVPETTQTITTVAIAQSEAKCADANSSGAGGFMEFLCGCFSVISLGLGLFVLKKSVQNARHLELLRLQIARNHRRGADDERKTQTEMLLPSSSSSSSSGVQMRELMDGL